MQIGERAYQSFSPEVRQSSDGKRTVIKIATESVDRHGTIIDARGVDLDAYKRNPVVLFNHDYDRVVGRAANIQMRGDNIVAEVEWDEDDPFAAEIARKMRAGFLNAASVGFMVQDGEDDEERGAYRITRSELVEFSIVAVPSNRDALVMSRSAAALADMRQQVEALQTQLQQLTDARQAPAEPADEAGTPDEPAEPAAKAAPEPEAAAAPEQLAPASGRDVSPNEPVRMAQADDYTAMARALQPVIVQSVLRALGKA